MEPDMEQNDPIGAVIDRLCHTREELAHQLGVSPAALYSWSVGRRSPRPANRSELAKIARAHARELTDLANALEGPGRRSHDGISRVDAPLGDHPLRDRHRVWRDQLQEVQSRAIEVRMQARNQLAEARRLAPAATAGSIRGRGDGRRP
jgi:hypothetical protein